METHHHRITLPIKDEPKATRWELERRLKEHGFQPVERTNWREEPMIIIDFFAPADANLDFLRPEFLPPK